MKAYSLFIHIDREVYREEHKEKTLLHLHTNPFAVDGIRVLDVAKRLGIENNVIFSYGKWKSGWSENAMSVLYNSCNCLLSASSGEGYCLPLNEAMACGLPIVGPRNSSFIELIGENINYNNMGKGGVAGVAGIGPRGLLVNGEYQYIIDGSQRFLVNERELADAMVRMYKYGTGNNGEPSATYDTYRNNCLRFAKLVSWDNIILDWDRLLKKL
jgi:glycosyltransferase involved in cell wall biosynthesis